MKKTKNFTLSVLPGKLAICHFAAKSAIPDWAKEISFCSITRTPDELSIVCLQDQIPGGVLYEKDWKAFRLENFPNGIHSVGVIASLSKPLADNKISIFNISTYETNYVLVGEKDFAKAKKILSSFCKIKK